MSTVSDLNLLTGSSVPLLASGDVLAFTDISDSTQSPGGSTVKATMTQFFAAIPAPIIITSTTAVQLQVKYDGSNHVTVAVSSAGAVTLNATGASAGFTFSDAVASGSFIDNAAIATGFAMGAKAGTRRISFSASAFNFINDADASAPIVIAGLTATTGTFSGLVQTTLSGSGNAVSIIPAASGTYGAQASLAWYRTNGSTIKGRMGFSDNDPALQIEALETAGLITLRANGTTAGQFDTSSTAADTRFLVYDVTAGALVRVSRGASDSGGAGFRVLRVPN